MILSLLTSLLFFAGSSTSPVQDRTFEGYVTDDMCAGEHMMEGMNDKECADECVKMGAVYALFVPADKKMYLADDPAKLESFAGEDVVVKGTLSSDGKTITVTSIEKAEGETEKQE